MKYRFSVLAAALATALVTILAPAARSGVVLEDLPAPGSQFRKTAFLEQDVLAEGGSVSRREATRSSSSPSAGARCAQRSSRGA